MNFPLVFVVEEVSFRGALDTHIQHPGERGGIWSAILVSSLWGLWHVPLAMGSAPLASLLMPHVVAHCLIGVPLSIYWRQSGNLVVPGAAHASVDALRNMLQ
ncbi:MAG: CPBP family intramembrane glutamic endopeptidase [Candidatus Angelobacter sp.]